MESGGLRTNPGMSVTEVTPADIPAYLQTGKAAYADHYSHLWPSGDPWPYTTRNFTPEILQAEIRDPELRVWLVRKDGVPAGICKVDFGKDLEGYPPGHGLFIEKIYFKKQYTGMGLGTALLTAITHLGRRCGRRILWLEAMQKGPALAFYRRFGFRILRQTRIPHPEVLEAEAPMWVLCLEI